MYPEKITEKSPDLFFINGRFSFLGISYRFEDKRFKTERDSKTIRRCVSDSFLITSEIKIAIAKMLLVHLCCVKNAVQMLKFGKTIKAVMGCSG